MNRLPNVRHLLGWVALIASKATVSGDVLDHFNLMLGSSTSLSCWYYQIHSD